MTGSILLCSCATILKKKTYNLNLYTNECVAKVKVNDSVYPLPATVLVKRSNKDLNLTLMLDSANVDYTVKAAPNSTFLYVNLAGVYFCPINYAIDFTNKKRFYYGKSVFLNTNDTSRVIYPAAIKAYHNYFTKKFPKIKGDIYIHLSVPYINSFYFKPHNEALKSNTGFFGFAFGVDYFYRNNQFISLYASGVTGFLAPFPVPVDYFGEHEVLYSAYMGLSNNHKLGRFSLGYGLSLSNNTWKLIGSDSLNSSSQGEISKTNTTLGLIFPAYYQFGKLIYAGVIYRPSFIRTSTSIAFQYEHLISLDVAVKLGMKKRRP